MGDLTKEDAHLYYRGMIEQVPEAKKPLFKGNADSFDSVFDMTGGRTDYIDQLIAQVLDDGAIPPGQGRHLHSSSISLRIHIPHRDHPM